MPRWSLVLIAIYGAASEAAPPDFSTVSGQRIRWRKVQEKALKADLATRTQGWIGSSPRPLGRPRS